MARLHMPLSTLHACPHGQPSMTRGRCDWLGLHRTTLSFATPHRFIPALLQLHMQVTTQRGQALGNIPVVFSTMAGTLSAVTHTNVVNNAHLPGVSTHQTAGHEITVR